MCRPECVQIKESRAWSFEGRAWSRAAGKIAKRQQFVVTRHIWMRATGSALFLFRLSSHSASQSQCTNLQNLVRLLRESERRKATEIQVRRSVYLWCKCHCFSEPQRSAHYARPTSQKFFNASRLAPLPLFDRKKWRMIQRTRLFIVQQWGPVRKVETTTTDWGHSRHKSVIPDQNSLDYFPRDGVITLNSDFYDLGRESAKLPATARIRKNT